MAQTTQSGEFVIYHVSEAGQPDAHDTSGGEWFFEPHGWGEGEVYSGAYPSAEAALAAAERWEAQEALEEHLRAEERSAAEPDERLNP